MSRDGKDTNGEGIEFEGIPTAGYGGGPVGPGAVIGRYKLLRLFWRRWLWHCLFGRAAAGGSMTCGSMTMP